MVQKKIPMRKCIACQQMKAKKELIRVVAGQDAAVSLDPTGKKPGRGAYICRTPDCFLTARKRKAFDRALKTQVPDEIYQKLQGDLAGVKPDA